MAWVIIAFDGEDAGAPARRAAARERHLAVAEAWARDGRLALSLPLFRGGGGAGGSLVVLNVPDRAGVEEYLRAEPFAAEGVWQRQTIHPGRTAPLPYPPLVAPGATTPDRRTDTVVVAMDGTDAGALERRLRVREAHFARLRPAARDGTVAMGVALLDPGEERMIGSVVVLRFDNDAAARAWVDTDAYVSGDVWRDITLYGTRFAALPYRPWPEAFHAATD